MIQLHWLTSKHIKVSHNKKGNSIQLCRDRNAFHQNYYGFGRENYAWSLHSVPTNIAASPNWIVGMLWFVNNDKNAPENITNYILFAFSDNNVLLGTRQGHLLMYAVEQNTNDGKMDLQLLQYDKNFSKKPITQIDVIPEHQLLFSLTDNLVTIHDINRTNFPVVHSNSNTKGATLFALNVKRSTSLTGETALVVRLCVVIKR